MRMSECTHFSFVYATTVKILAGNLLHVLVVVAGLYNEVLH